MVLVVVVEVKVTEEKIHQQIIIIIHVNVIIVNHLQKKIVKAHSMINLIKKIKKIRKNQKTKINMIEKIEIKINTKKIHVVDQKIKMMMKNVIHHIIITVADTTNLLVWVLSVVHMVIIDQHDIIVNHQKDQNLNKEIIEEKETGIEIEVIVIVMIEKEKGMKKRNHKKKIFQKK